MEENKAGNDISAVNQKKGGGCLRLLGFAALAVVVIALIIAGWVKYNVYASPYTPTELSVKEQKVLKSKLALLSDSPLPHIPKAKSESPAPLTPEAYSEVGARREIRLTEKELNGLIGEDPEMARRVAIDLSDSLVSVKLVISVDKEVIIFGGKTLRLNLGVILDYKNNKPVVAIKGISIGGIPLPNAWLGYLKGKDLVDEFGTEEGFWKLFSEGIKDVKVRDGHILISLNE
jgi:hypothetical protein